jgi:hypothetical protein
MRMYIRASVTTWRPLNVSRDLRKIGNIFPLLYHHIKIVECGVIVKHHPVVLLNNGLSCVTCGKYVKILQFCEVITCLNIGTVK